ncbi:MAG: hypothetical protein IPG24_27990 [Leptospiraceae bacterium]|nr:hypothetical protein [Leptospiraceae bacterium]
MQSEIKIGKDVIGYLCKVYYSEYSPFILPEEQELVNSVAMRFKFLVQEKNRPDSSGIQYETTLGMRVVNMAY